MYVTLPIGSPVFARLQPQVLLCIQPTQWTKKPHSSKELWSKNAPIESIICPASSKIVMWGFSPLPIAAPYKINTETNAIKPIRLRPHHCHATSATTGMTEWNRVHVWTRGTLLAFDWATCLLVSPWKPVLVRATALH